MPCVERGEPVSEERAVRCVPGSDAEASTRVCEGFLGVARVVPCCFTALFYCRQGTHA